MFRALTSTALLFALCALLLPAIMPPAILSPASVFADDALSVASDEEAKDAIKVFRKEFKAKGLKGDDKLMQRDWALSELSKVQHQDVVSEIGKITRHGNIDLRTLAVIYLGDMRAFPGTAGKRIVDAMKKNDKDTVLVMSALQSLSQIGYLGAQDELRDFLKARDYALRKYAIRTIGDLADIRMLEDLLKILGIDAKNEKQQGDNQDKDGGEKKTGEKEVVEEGYSWDGAEVFYDTGTAGDGDQKMAEKLGKEKLAQNKAAAQSKAGGGGGSGSSMGGSGDAPRGGASRTVEELVPAILKALYRMTGVKFDNGADIKAWLAENGDTLVDRAELLDEMEKAQAKKK